MMDETNSVVMGTTSGMRMMADGTIRISFDFEPRHGQVAFNLFGTPGSPVAVARIMPEVAQQHARQQAVEEARPKGGELCKLAGVLCNSEPFRTWLRITYDPLPQTAEDAATIVRQVCKVGSRAELDHNPEAAQRFHTIFRLPYTDWLKKQGRGGA